MFKTLSTDLQQLFLSCYSKVLKNKETMAVTYPDLQGLVIGVNQAKKLLSLLNWIVEQTVNEQTVNEQTVNEQTVDVLINKLIDNYMNKRSINS